MNKETHTLQFTTDQICKCLMPSVGSNNLGECKTCGQSLLFRSGKISIITWYLKEFVAPSFEGIYLVDLLDGKTHQAYYEINEHYRGFFKHKSGDNIDKNVVMWSYLPESQSHDLSTINNG